MGGSEPLTCRYFEAGICRSCTRIETPIDEQIRIKERRTRALLDGVPGARTATWLPLFAGADRGFRNRAKLVVGGETGAVTLGILGPERRGADLRECAIQEPAIAAAIPRIARFLDRLALPPYSVPERRGELKFVHLTASPSGRLMARFVVRTDAAARAIAERAGSLRSTLPEIDVATVNLLPGHRAVLEGEEERPLWGRSLPMELGPVTMHLLPRSFFQTNTDVARELYRQVSDWVLGQRPSRVWDLYCGVGGFALHIAAGVGARGRSRGATAAGGPSADGGAAAGNGFAAGNGSAGRNGSAGGSASRMEVLGVEVTPEAVKSARRSARDAGLAVRFVAADATGFARSAPPIEQPDLAVVNPPRRGLGPELSEWIETSAIRHLVYSSCNPESLAEDLRAMPSFELVSARLFDMFPHTDHLEAAVLLRRIGYPERVS